MMTDIKRVTKIAPIILITGSIIMIIFATFSFFNSINPPNVVGPVGDGSIDRGEIITNYIWRLVGSIAFLILGIYIIYHNKKSN